MTVQKETFTDRAKAGRAVVFLAAPNNKDHRKNRRLPTHSSAPRRPKQRPHPRQWTIPNTVPLTHVTRYMKRRN